MIFNFTIPTIEDSTDFASLPTKQVSLETMDTLRQATEFRDKYKVVLKELFLKYKSFGESFLLYKGIAEDYLSKNIDVMTSLARTPTNPIKLTWTTFIDKKNKTFTTKGGNEEALAIELIMVRYTYAFAFYTEAEPLVNQIRDKLSTTFKSNSATVEIYQKTLQEILELYYNGWEKVRKLYNVIHLISKSIVMQEGYCIEAKGNTLDVVKNILDVNANSMHLEGLRLKKEFERMAKVCNANIYRFQQAKFMLENDKPNVNDELLDFIQLGLKFYKAFGMWALMNHYENLIKKEEYEKKDFRRLSQEMFCMSDLSLEYCDEIKKLKPVNANILFCQTYVGVFEPTCVNCFQLYKGIHQNSEKLDGSKCLLDLGEEDYLEVTFSRLKSPESMKKN
jgi:hypothetical protein